MHRLLLTEKILAAAGRKARANDPVWRAFEARLETQLPIPIGADYQASGTNWIPDYALGYRILRDIDAKAAIRYADKAIGLLKSAIRDFQRADNSCLQFVGRGDGKEVKFRLPHSDVAWNGPESFLPHLGPVKVSEVTRGGAPVDLVRSTDNEPLVNADILKVSNTRDGAPDYKRDDSWRANPLAWGAIEWRPSAAQPETGATYYVSYVSGFDLLHAGVYLPADPRAEGPWKLADDVLTFETAPKGDQAVYARYCYGVHATDASTLAYQQSGFGYGGLASIRIDAGYSGRYLGKNVSLGLDWLDGYRGLTPALAAEIRGVLVLWYDWLAARGYGYRTLYSNYGAGDHVSQVFTALALEGREPAHGARLVRSISEFRAHNVAGTLRDGMTFEATQEWPAMAPVSYRGGYWAEGWNYGPLAAKNLLLAGLAWETGGKGQAAIERHWASEVIAHLLSAQPAGPGTTTLFDGGDWYQYPAALPTKDFWYVLAFMADDPTRVRHANWVIQNNPPHPVQKVDQVDTWESVLFRDPEAEVATWEKALPLEWLCDGTGLLTARSDWSESATWLSLLMGNCARCDHQDFTPGMLQIQRGADDLLINVGTVCSVQGLPRAAHGNCVIVDDNGDGAQVYRWRMGWWYGRPGVRVLAYEASKKHVYLAGDYRAAYSSTRVPDGGSVRELTRQLVFVRPNLVFVYDRATTRKPDYPKQLRWHFGQAPELARDTWTVQVGTSKLFGRTYSSQPIRSSTDAVKGLTPAAYAVTVEPTAVAERARFATVIQVSPAEATLAPSVSVHSDDHRMEGATLGDALVLFGTDGDLGPGSVTYTLPRGGTVAHVLLNLPAGRTYRVTLEGSLLGTYRASAAGVLRFSTPAGGRVIVG